MMTQAFYTGLSGLQTTSYGIDVISDNLANVNTVGYRGNSYEFSSLFEDAVMAPTQNNTTSDSIGLGTSLQTTSMTQSSGSYMLTDKSTDLAIFGEGWFGVQYGEDTYYTRDGAFTFDSADDLVTSDGYHVLGSMGGNIDGNVLTQPLDTVALGDVNAQEELNFPQTLTYPPEATTTVTFSGNIGTIDETRTMSAGIIDADGNSNELRLEYTLSDTQNATGTRWDVTAVTTSADGETIYDTQSGVVEFDETGALISNSLTTIDNNGSPVTIDLGAQYSGIVSVANSDIISSSTADGAKSGDLIGYDVNMNGEVIATFTNGKQSSVGKIGIYHFQNDQGLDRVSGSLFSESSNSGNAFLYKNENGENIVGSEIRNFQLEGSNVDMTNGLTELIILQRSYDANSKSITTADEMMQKALEMDA